MAHDQNSDGSIRLAYKSVTTFAVLSIAFALIMIVFSIDTLISITSNDDIAGPVPYIIFAAVICLMGGLAGFRILEITRSREPGRELTIDANGIHAPASPTSAKFVRLNFQDIAVFKAQKRKLGVSTITLKDKGGNSIGFGSWSFGSKETYLDLVALLQTRIPVQMKV